MGGRGWIIQTTGLIGPQSKSSDTVSFGPIHTLLCKRAKLAKLTFFFSGSFIDKELSVCWIFLSNGIWWFDPLGWDCPFYLWCSIVIVHTYLGQAGECYGLL